MFRLHLQPKKQEKIEKFEKIGSIKLKIERKVLTHRQNGHGKRGNSNRERRTNRRNSSSGSREWKPRRREPRRLWSRRRPFVPNRRRRHQHQPWIGLLSKIGGDFLGKINRDWRISRVGWAEKMMMSFWRLSVWRMVCVCVCFVWNLVARGSKWELKISGTRTCLIIHIPCHVFLTCYDVLLSNLIIYSW